MSLDQRNVRPIWFKSSPVRVAYSDASDTSYGGYIVELGPQMASQGVWSLDMANQSMTLREILAACKVWQSFAHDLAGLCVKWFTDNQNVVHIIDISSPKLLSSMQKKPGAFFIFLSLTVFQSSSIGCLGPVVSKLII